MRKLALFFSYHIVGRYEPTRSSDFDPDNVLVDIARNKETNAIRLEHFAIVDFGSPGVWLRRKVPSEQTFVS